MSRVTTATITTGSWRELLGPKNLGASTVLAGGVALYATNEFLTISLMPSAVADIGGHRLLRVGDHRVPGGFGGGGDHRALAAD